MCLELLFESFKFLLLPALTCVIYNIFSPDQLPTNLCSLAISA